MTFLDIIETLPAHVINRGADFSALLRHVVAGDLMSDILVADFEDFLIVTSLASEQTLRTADIVGAKGVLLVNDKTPQAAVKTLAAQQGITVLSTPLSLFEACVALGALLVAPADLDIEEQQ